MAYSTSAGFGKPRFKDTDNISGWLVGYVGTQSDKTIDAMLIVDSLIMHTPLLENKIETTRREMLNARCNRYPDFRSLPSTVATDLRDGFKEDPVEDFMAVMNDTDADLLKDVWSKYVSGRNVVWCIIGNQDKVDMAALEQFGPVTILKGADVIK